MEKISYPETKEKIVTFIRSSIQSSGATGAVIGLSGGIDSALTAYLTVEALGKDKVLGLMLPEKGISAKTDIDDAVEIAKILGIDHNIIEISQVLASFSSAIPVFDRNVKTANGNLKARTRMCILYYHANLMNRMVIGTGNKTELLLGYFTKYGDGGVDIEPIGDLYKTQVRGLSRYMGVPLRIIEKTPTAGLWPGQTDESELGVSYEMADRILTMLVDEEKKKSEVKSKFPAGIVDKLAARISANEHKRIAPQCVEI
ncbi:MAG: NAD+ synthase [Candidatus Methanoperedens sp.]|nr:NAD+ synthase [Candidatus Methanoperedens sp.]